MNQDLSATDEKMLDALEKTMGLMAKIGIVGWKIYTEVSDRKAWVCGFTAEGLCRFTWDRDRGLIFSARDAALEGRAMLRRGKYIPSVDPVVHR